MIIYLKQLKLPDNNEKLMNLADLGFYHFWLKNQ